MNVSEKGAKSESGEIHAREWREVRDLREVPELSNFVFCARLAISRLSRARDSSRALLAIPAIAHGGGP